MGVTMPGIGISGDWEAADIRGTDEPEPGLLRCFWWAAKVVTAWVESAMIQGSLKVSPRCVGETSRGRVDGAEELEGVRFVVEAVGGGALPVGSSAALVVGAVRGFGLWLGVELEDSAVYRLSAAAHSLAQKGGSAYDVAASAMGGWVLYERAGEGPLPWEGWDWEACRDQETLAATLGFALGYGTWPRVRRRKRLSMGVLAADTGVKAITAPLLAKFDRVRERDEVKGALQAHQAASNRLAKGIWGGESAALVRDSVRENVQTLREFDRASGIGIYTPEIDGLLFEAARSGVAAKISGAGGGDWVVGLTWGKDEYALCSEAWSRAGFRVVPLVAPM